MIEFNCRYGGWTQAHVDNATFDGRFSGTEDNFVVWFNNKGFHAIPAYTNAIHNSMLRTIAKEQHEDPREYGISTWVQPIKLEGHQVWDQSV